MTEYRPPWHSLDSAERLAKVKNDSDRTLYDVTIKRGWHERGHYAKVGPHETITTRWAWNIPPIGLKGAELQIPAEITYQEEGEGRVRTWRG